jgi:hypothetical protein
MLKQKSAQAKKRPHPGGHSGALPLFLFPEERDLLSAIFFRRAESFRPKPEIAAMTGLDSFRREGPMGPGAVIFPSKRFASPAEIFATAFRSAPAQKAPPALHRTATAE